MSTPAEVVLIAFQNLHFVYTPAPSFHARACAFETLVRAHILQHFHPTSDECIHAFLSLYARTLWPARKAERIHLVHPAVNAYPHSFVYRRDGRVAATTLAGAAKRGRERTEAMNVARSRLGMAVRAYIRALESKPRQEASIVAGDSDELVRIVTRRKGEEELMDKADEAGEVEELGEDASSAGTS